MKRIIYTLLILLAFNATAQNTRTKCLTYTEIMRFVKMDSWTEINDSLTTKKFNYAGTGNQSKNTKAYWAKNCSLEFNEEGLSKINPSYESIYEVFKLDGLDKTTNRRDFTYYFDSKKAYKAFLDDAKNDGFIFRIDRPESNCIISIFTRLDSISGVKYQEFLRIYIKNDGMYIIEYYIITLAQSNNTGQKETAQDDKQNYIASMKNEQGETNRTNESNGGSIRELRAFRYQHLAALDENFKELESHPTSGTIVIGNTDEGEWVIVGVAGTELSGKVVKRNPTEKPDKNHEIYSCLFGSDYEGQRVVLVLDEYYDTSISKLVPEKVILSMLDPKTAETTVAFLFTKITRAR